MSDMGATYRQIAQRIGCGAMTAKRASRSTQDKCGKKSWHRSFEKHYTIPREDRRILQLALANRRMMTAEIREEVTGRVSLRTVAPGICYWNLGSDLHIN